MEIIYRSICKILKFLLVFCAHTVGAFFSFGPSFFRRKKELVRNMRSAFRPSLFCVAKKELVRNMRSAFRPSLFCVEKKELVRNIRSAFGPSFLRNKKKLYKVHNVLRKQSFLKISKCNGKTSVGLMGIFIRTKVGMYIAICSPLGTHVVKVVTCL